MSKGIFIQGRIGSLYYTGKEMVAYAYQYYFLFGQNKQHIQYFVLWIMEIMVHLLLCNVSVTFFASMKTEVMWKTTKWMIFNREH